PIIGPVDRGVVERDLDRTGLILGDHARVAGPVQAGRGARDAAGAAVLRVGEHGRLAAVLRIAVAVGVVGDAAEAALPGRADRGRVRDVPARLAAAAAVLDAGANRGLAAVGRIAVAVGEPLRAGRRRRRAASGRG